jgi:hypothetical protein
MRLEPDSCKVVDPPPLEGAAVVADPAAVVADAAPVVVAVELLDLEEPQAVRLRARAPATTRIGRLRFTRCPFRGSWPRARRRRSCLRAARTIYDDSDGTKVK